jgi:hypothetical protein
VKFRPIKRFAETSIDKAIEWIRMELNGVLRELFIGLYNLTFEDNFLSFEWEGSIVAGAEQQITHNLRVTPTRFLIVSATNVNTIVFGTTASTPEVFYVKNIASSSTFTGKVLVLP